MSFYVGRFVIVIKHHRVNHVMILQRNLQRFTGRNLLNINDAEQLSEAVFEAGFAVLSHTNAEDPVFNYANRKALELFEVDWQGLMHTPSRLSAESENRDERDKLLQRVARDNFIDDYSGIRISAKGNRFQIEQAIVWNLYYDDMYYGQAAMFSQWKML